MEIRQKEVNVIRFSCRQDKKSRDRGACLWADCDLDPETGTLSIISDSGNYSCRWPEKGNAFLKLMAGMGGGRNYLLEKFAGGKPYTEQDAGMVRAADTFCVYIVPRIQKYIMNRPTVEMTLVLSTRHISYETELALIAEKIKDLIYYEKTEYETGEEYGWWIYTGDSWFEDEHEDIPDDLMGCMRYANDRGCCWLCLDRDEDIIFDLPEYDW